MREVSIRSRAWLNIIAALAFTPKLRFSSSRGMRSYLVTEYARLKLGGITLKRRNLERRRNR